MSIPRYDTKTWRAIAQNFIYDQWNHLFNKLKQALLSRNCFQLFEDAIYAKGAPQDNSGGLFIGLPGHGVGQISIREFSLMGTKNSS